MKLPTSRVRSTPPPRLPVDGFVSDFQITTAKHGSLASEDMKNGSSKMASRKRMINPSGQKVKDVGKGGKRKRYKNAPHHCHTTRLVKGRGSRCLSNDHF